MALLLPLPVLDGTVSHAVDFPATVNGSLGVFMSGTGGVGVAGMFVDVVVVGVGLLGVVEEGLYLGVVILGLAHVLVGVFVG
jgi:hypothetical protein